MKRFAADPPVRRLVAAFLSYAAFFLALFAQFPRKGALHGNCDTLIALALSNTYIAKAAALLGFGGAGSAMYPEGNVLAYGEAAPGVSAIYIAFRLIGFNDVVASYFFISSVFALTALGAYVFAGLFVRMFAARWFAGFAFACSNMMFAHIDDSAVIFYLFPLLALTFLVRYFRTHDARFLTAAALTGAAQAYCSVYVFVYQSILLAFFILIHHFARPRQTAWSAYLKPAAIYVAAAAPILLFYLGALRFLDIVTPFEPAFVTRAMSWQPADVFLAMNGNLLYGRFNPLRPEWNIVRHFNFIGLLMVAGGGAALLLRGRHRLLLGGVGVIGLLLAVGPVVGEVPSPLYPLYEWLPILRFHRIPVRAYFLVLLALTVLTSVTLEWLLIAMRSQRFDRVLVVGLFAAFHFFENVPLPLPAYAELGSKLALPAEYRAFLDSANPDSLILDLPSRIGLIYSNWNPDNFEEIGARRLAPLIEAKQGTEIIGSDRDIFLYNREALYLNWQTQHRRNIVNGVNGYFPATRLVFDRWIEDLPSERTLLWLRKQGVDYLVFHKGLLLWNEHTLLAGLAASPLLRSVFSGDEIAVYEFRP